MRMMDPRRTSGIIDALDQYFAPLPTNYLTRNDIIVNLERILDGLRLSTNGILARAPRNPE